MPKLPLSKHTWRMAASTATALIDASVIASMTNTECHLLRLPAELRNAIFNLVIHPGESVEVTAARWPGITGTCKQIRAESLPVYLGSANLVAQIRDLKDEPLLHWLNIVSGLPPYEKRLIRSITIACSGTILDSSLIDGFIEYQPTLQFWETITSRIRAAGLKPHQLAWAGVDVAELRAMEQEEAQNKAAELYLFHTFILMPLLRGYGFEICGRSSADIAEQIVGADVIPLVPRCGAEENVRWCAFGFADLGAEGWLRAVVD